MSRPASPVSERFWAKVDKSGSCWEWAASKNDFGYGRFKQDGTQKYAHRISYELAYGPIPAGMVIDHKCHNTSCVRPDHLRACSQKENLEHRAGAQPRNISGVRGVTWDANARNWRAAVGHEGRTIHVGHFATIAEAESAVIAKRLELFTHNDADRRDS